MSDREPRKRRKKRENQKKEDLNADEVIPPGKKSQEEWHKDSEPEPEEEPVLHEPSVIAKVIFFLIFSLLIVATGAVFIALHNADRGKVESDNFTELSSFPSGVVYENVQQNEYFKSNWYPNAFLDTRSIGIIDLETSHSEVHTQELPVTVTEDWKSEDTSKEGVEETELWVEETEREQLPDLEILPQEEIIPPLEETIESPGDYYTEEMSEDADSQVEFKEKIDEEIQETEKEFVESPTEKSQQEYYEQVEIPSRTEEIASTENVESEETLQEILPSTQRNEEQLFQEMHETIYLETSNEPVTESEYPFEEREDLLVQGDEDDIDRKEHSEHTGTTGENIQEIEVETHETKEPDISSDTDDTPSESVQQEWETSPVPEEAYERQDITNEQDFVIRKDLDEIDRIIDKSPDSAMKLIEDVLKHHPNSPRAHLAKATVLDKMSEEQRSNALLEKAINEYAKILTLPNVPDKIFLTAGKKAIERMRFRGFIGKAVRLQHLIADHFPEDADVKNQLAVSYLLIGKGQQAKKILEEVLQKHPENGFAKVHYGFILKTEDKNYPEAIKYLSEGIATRESGVIDGRFYFHLGDALSRTGKPNEAMSVYEEGVQNGVFLSVYQRSLYNVDGLKGKPWWDPKETPYYSSILLLEKDWQVIRNEALTLMNDDKSGFLPENEGLRDTGDWKQFELFARGQKMVKNCQRAPITCSLVEKIPDAAYCRRGQVKFSVLHPGTHIWAHTGPTNCRLRGHLGLVVPDRVQIRVANDTRWWKEGKMIIFDDSFEHEVWHTGDKARLVLIVDFWHPQLTAHQKATLTPI